MKRLVLLVAVLGFACLFTGRAFGDILNVPTAEYPNIQAGIDAASSGDTVQVAPGTYHENITMKSGVVIQGAGQGISIIDGGGNGFVVTASIVNSAAKLDGFTITNVNATYFGMYNYNSSPTVTNCTFSGNSASNGGGMYNFFYSSPTVSNCTFSGNSASNGGGMYNINSSPTVTNCTFSENTASDGGGMYNDSSSPVVTNCTFSGNSAVRGGGMQNALSSATVTNCTFSGNTATTGNGLGGGMYNLDSSLTVTNCTFSGNSAGAGGGGMMNDEYSSSTVTNCTFSGNNAFYGGGMENYNHSWPAVTNCTFSGNSAVLGGGMYNESSSSPTVTNNILWGDSPDEIYNASSSSPSVAYSDIQGGYAGTGNINADPLLADVANGDLHLQQGSPCIDAGDNSAPSLPATDFEGDDRKIDDPKVADTGNGTSPIVDMGADEYAPKEEEFPWEMFLPAIIKKK